MYIHADVIAEPPHSAFWSDSFFTDGEWLVPVLILALVVLIPIVTFILIKVLKKKK